MTKLAKNAKYPIERRYITNENARPRLPIAKVRFLVAHETANNTADADNHYTYFNRIDFSASAHTFIDADKILEIIPLDEKAWHVNYGKPADNQLYGDDANDAAIGVELCRTGDFDEAYERYVWYFAYLCDKFGFNPREHIVAHAVLDPQRRSDPESWLNPNGVSWSDFINDVQACFDGDGAKTYKPEERREKAHEITKQGENSIVDYLNARNKDASFGAREKLANKYGVNGYRGTAEQNLRLLELLRKDAKPKPAKADSISYDGNSIVDYLNLIGENASFSNREKLAKQFGINGYSGTASQNIELLDRMRVGGKEPEPAPKSNVKRVTLPASADTWRTYKLNVQPVKRNSDWSLTPAAFGGLTYKILDEPYANVVTIETSRGKRNIYVAPSTGAKIK